MLTRTSTSYQCVLASDGKLPSRCPLARKSLIWVSAGTCTHKLYTFPMRKRPGIWQPSQNGGRSAHTTSSRCRSCMESCYTQLWSSQRDVCISPTWRPCLPLSITVLSAHTPHPEIPQMIWPGGSASSSAPTFPSPFPGPNHLLNTELTQMRALASVWRSRLARDGEHGDSLQGGSPKAGTSSGPRLSDLNCLPSAYAPFQREVSTLLSTATTGELSKDGGRDVVPTGRPTTSSDASSNFRRIAVERYTRDMFQVRRTLLMLPPAASTPPAPSSLTQLSSPLKSGAPSSLMSDPGELARRAVIKHFVQTQDPETDVPGIGSHVPNQRRVPEARPRHLPIPSAATLTARGPAPYPQHLTPVPSRLCPHCLAKDRLRLWISPAPIPIPANSPMLSEIERERVKDTMIHAWEEDTRVAYGAGLLMWHCFCDEKGISEEVRAPATQALLSAFIAHLAAAYSGRTISGYLSGVQAWHILHGFPWALEKKEMDTMLRAADKLTPSASKQKKRRPYTPDFISSVRAQLDLERPLDAAVFACLTTCFYTSARLGEFTTRTLSSFSPNTQISPLRSRTSLRTRPQTRTARSQSRSS
jgi:hypothetical protein